jgi:VIT1/CCC1 family predicted Fe2+/Mn2+ transporter
MMAHDALEAHARDELGISETLTARPIQAAFASAASFAAGASLPMVVVALTNQATVFPMVASTSLGFLALLGGVAARAGGAPVLTGAARVTLWGAVAMGVTAAVGSVFGATP